MNTKNLINMAKSTKTSPAKKVVKKEVKKEAIKEVKKVIEQPIEEDRETKAKKTVEKLLEGISLNPFDYKKKAEEPEFDGGEIDDGELNPSGGNEWLEQQVTELTQLNEYLRNQLASATPNNNVNQYNRDGIMLADNNVKENVVKLFTELQTVYINVGFNYNFVPPRSNMIIYPEQFMIRLLDLFPFLEDFRKVQLQ